MSGRGAGSESWWKRVASWAAGNGAVGNGGLTPGDIPKLVIHGAKRVNLARIAAALAYRTMFGLVPAIVIGLVVMAAFAKPEDVTASVRKILAFARLDQIQIKAEDAGGGGVPSPGSVLVPKALMPGVGALKERAEKGAATRGGEERPAGAGVDTTATFGEGAVTVDAARLDKWIEQLVARVQSIRLGAISVVGFVMLIYAAISMMVEIEKAFNQIFLTPVGRSWARRVPLYWTLLTLGMVGLVATFSVQEGMQSKLNELAKSQASVPIVGLVLAQVASYGITVGISTLFFFLAYTTVPNTRVRRRPALVGAASAAVMWEAGKWGFTEYLRYSGGGAKLYGLIALVPLFMLWVYMTWMVILMGLQIAQATQLYGVAREKGMTPAMLGLIPEGAGSRRSVIVDPGSIVMVAVAAAERFRMGKPIDHIVVGQATGLEERVAGEMLERLAVAGLLVRVAGDQEGVFTLARPPEAIGAVEVMGLGEEMAGGGRGMSSRVMAGMAAARREALAGKSLADLLDGSAGAGASTLGARAATA